MIDFELIVPDGWVRVPTTPQTSRLRSRVIEDIVRTHLPDSLPRDTVGPWRKMLRARITEATADAAEAGARAVVLPLSDYDGFRLPGSMVMTIVEDHDAVHDPEVMLASILQDGGPDGTYLEIGGSSAVRVQSVVDSDPINRPQPSRKVDYFIAHPDVPGVWGLLTFTVLTDGDVDAEPVQAIVLLFDMVIGTLRWTDDVAVPTEDELLERLPT